MLATEKEGCWDSGKHYFLHPKSRIAFFEELTLLEKRNLLICEKRLEKLNQFLKVR